MSQKQWRHGFCAGKERQYIKMKDEDIVETWISEICQLRWYSKHLLLSAVERIEQIDTDPRPYVAEDISVLIRSAEELFNNSNRLATEHSDLIAEYEQQKYEQQKYEQENVIDDNLYYEKPGTKIV